MELLKYIQGKYNTSTAFQLNRIVEKLAMAIRKETNKESISRGKYKSPFTNAASE